MADQKLDRRAFFKRAVAIGAAATGASAFLAACKNEGGGGGGTQPAAKTKVDCSDLSALTEQQKTQREALKYVDKSPKPEQNCANCKLYEKKEPCNGCSVVPGPIDPKGWCTAWQKAA